MDDLQMDLDMIKRKAFELDQQGVDVQLTLTYRYGDTEFTETYDSKRYGGLLLHVDTRRIA